MPFYVVVFSLFLKGLVCFSLLGGCAPPHDTVKVGVCADNPPFTFVNPQESKDVQGFDIDLIKALGAKMGIKCVFYDMDFASLIAALYSKRVDMAIASFEQTPERLKNMDFSKAYHKSPYAFLSMQSPTPSLLEGNQKIGAQLGSSHERFLKTLQTAHRPFEVISYNRIGEMIQDLKNKRLHWIILDAQTAQSISKKFHMPIKFFNNEGASYHIVFSKGSEHKTPVNRALEDIAHEGLMKKIITKWLIETKASHGP